MMLTADDLPPKPEPLIERVTASVPFGTQKRIRALAAAEQVTAGEFVRHLVTQETGPLIDEAAPETAAPRVVLERHDAAATFLLERTLQTTRPFYPPFAGFIVHDRGRPYGALLLNCWTDHEVRLTATVFRPWPISIARELARICFVDLGVARVAAMTRPSNTRAVEALQACGFKLERIARDHFGTEDGHDFVLLRRDQTFMRI